jgi:hypothetical protein
MPFTEKIDYLLLFLFVQITNLLWAVLDQTRISFHIDIIYVT